MERINLKHLSIRELIELKKDIQKELELRHTIRKCLGCGKLIRIGLYCINCINKRADNRKHFENFMKRGILIDSEAREHLMKFPKYQQEDLLKKFVKDFPTKRVIYKGDLI
jgi:hypothetical protein